MAARTYAFSDFPRCTEEDLPAEPAPWPTSAFQGNYCKSQADAAIFAMGYSVRSATHRYTRWMHWDGSALAVRPDGWLDGAVATANLLGEELYDHTGDGESHSTSRTRDVVKTIECFGTRGNIRQIVYNDDVVGWCLLVG